MKKEYEFPASEGISVRRAKIANKQTYILKMDENAYSKISHLWKIVDPASNRFHGAPNSNLLVFAVDGYRWELHLSRIKKFCPETSTLKYEYELWGACGDSWFGRSPSYMMSKYGGNLKVARKIFTLFIESLSEKRGKIVSQKFGF